MNEHQMDGPFFTTRKTSLHDTTMDSYLNAEFVAEKKPRCSEADMIVVKEILLDSYQPIWTRLPRHRHVSKVLAIRDDGTIKVPYYENGNIINYNRRSGASDFDKMLQITQFASGLNHLHENGVVHGNFCPANVLVQFDGSVCISDPSLNLNMTKLSTFKPVPSSYPYKSPQDLLDPSEASYEGDVYSWASVVYEVFSGRRPYHRFYYGCSVVKIVRDGHRTLERPSEISPQLWDIMLRCWAFEPASRPLMHEVEAELHDL